MNLWDDIISGWDLYQLEIQISSWFFVIAMAYFAFELLRLILKKAMTWNILGDSITNGITLFLSFSVIFAFGATYYYTLAYFQQNFSIAQLPINWLTIPACIILADFVYYWEHRAMHRISIGWANHTVHHSSPYFNISVAYRFGPLNAFIPIFFHIPLAMLGFNPFLIIFSEIMVQLYQTILHTETIGKLPRPVEAVMNTPSHHRVHHGSNPQYIDKNYAGIFIIWDRMFGTFEEEKEKVIYGVVPQINTVNPSYVFLHGLVDLAATVWKAKGIKSKLLHIVMPPEWKPDENRPVVSTSQRSAGEGNKEKKNEQCSL